MPIKDADPDRYQTLLNLGEDKKNQMFSLLPQLGARLFPRESEFVKLCISGGGDRAQKVNKLIEFETAIFFVSRINLNRYGDMDIKVMKCWSLRHVFIHTQRLYNLLHLDLKEFCEELDVPLTIQKSPSIDNAYDRITRLLNDADLANESTADYEPEALFREIEHTGIQYYGTLAQDQARGIIDNILEIEHEIEHDDCTDDELVSKIERQIKLVETLPYHVVEHELGDLIKDIILIDPMDLFLNVEKLVDDTRAAMRKYKEMSGYNDLDKTLDLLIAEADSFEEEWERKYSRFFTSDDRPDSKRQRTE